MARGGLRCSSHWPTSLSPLSMSYVPRVDGMSGETWDLGPASSSGCWKGGRGSPGSRDAGALRTVQRAAVVRQPPRRSP